MQFAVKKLTMSDLTFFDSQYRKFQQEARAKGEQGSKQKGINLNANVFADLVFPHARGDGNRRRFPMPVTLYGPGNHHQPQLVTRKVISPGGGGKNWRLNGELIPDPEFDPGRYGTLEPGDLVVFGLEGDAEPTAMSLVLVSRTDREDMALHAVLSRLLGNNSMSVLTSEQMEGIVAPAPPEHSIRELIDPDLDEALEEAARGSAEGVRRLRARGLPRRMTAEALRAARQRAEAIGRSGEVLLNEWLASRVKAGQLMSVTWISDVNAVNPWDFEVEEPDGTLVRIELKTTTGKFDNPIFIAQSEIENAASSSAPRTDLYRLYEIDESGAKLAIATDIRSLASEILLSPCMASARASLPTRTPLQRHASTDGPRRSMLSRPKTMKTRINYSAATIRALFALSKSSVRLASFDLQVISPSKAELHFQSADRRGSSFRRSESRLGSFAGVRLRGR